MKNTSKIFGLTLAIILFSGCYDRDIIDSKVSGYSMPDVENLSIYSPLENVLTLSWKIPENISGDFRRPIQIKIQTIENNVYKNLTTLSEVTFHSLTINPNIQYRFIVRTCGYLLEELEEEGKTNVFLSEGKMIEKE